MLVAGVAVSDVVGSLDFAAEVVVEVGAATV